LKLLAFDTSTEVLSLAVQAPRLAAPIERDEPGAARASAALIPSLLELLAAAELRLEELDAIVFGAGPGSFTGLRTACSVAQGLALGAGVPVLAVETLQAVAEDARAQGAGSRVFALLDARMGEVYAAGYEHRGGAWHRDAPIMLSQPQDVAVPAGWTQAGNVFTAYGDRLPAGPRVPAMPRAGALLRLAPALLAAGAARPAAEALPLYVRDKVAQTTAERMAARAAGAGAKMTP
jgi:tRNA threonylcarbamoyladenosine biosynthesis protein TsaB